MEIARETIIAFIIILTLLAVSGILVIFWYRFRFHNRQRQKKLMTEFMVKGLEDNKKTALFQEIQKKPRQLLEAFIESAQVIASSESRITQVARFLLETGIHRDFIQSLSRSNPYKRMEGAVYLGYLPNGETVDALHKALSAEKDARAKLYIANALTDIRNPASIPYMVESLFGEKNWYRTRVNMMLVSFQQIFADYVPSIISREEKEIKSLLVDFGCVFPSDTMRDYLKRQIELAERDIAYRAARGLANLYPEDVFCDFYILHQDPVIRNIVIKALIMIPEKRVVTSLLPLLEDKKCHESTVATMSEIVRKRPSLIEYLIGQFEAETNQMRLDGLAKVLSNRIEYILLKLLTDRSSITKRLVVNLVLQGKYSGLISFLNRNSNIDLENRIVEILRPLTETKSDLKDEAQVYLKERILKKLGFTPYVPENAPRTHAQSKGKQTFLLILLAASFTIMPLLYVIMHYHELFIWDWHQHAVQLVLDCNYYIAYYALTINSIYLILMLLSFSAASSQMRLWSLKKPKFLFKPRILPGISIIAPAYREAATIVESVHSLLNLRYPNYELIVVNDGSPDNTLATLIEEFDLEKVDIMIPQKLKSMPIRGIYANKSLPKLLVVDKVNGGKADTLNAGINLSSKEFFCGIDADSLLESDSLIKLTSLTLDSTADAVALGGNIFPINGCMVSKGVLGKINIPQNSLARFQTIEYVRAFMTGRLGWAKMKCLLIISGAFGLFYKDRVVEIGGYLTSKERYQLDTVGEDMELVVRLEHTLLEQKKPFAVMYSYNANCWTEVPEKLHVLYRQRDRWQRGLIDVIHFHLKMLLNPRFERIGILAMPYFVIFELLGPLIEIQGYLMVILAFFLGLLNEDIALLLFAASIVYGIVISIASLIITVQDNQYFPTKELFILILYAIAENFGIRQFFSLWRTTGFFNSLRSTQAWGSMPRKGFSVSSGSSQSA